LYSYQSTETAFESIFFHVTGLGLVVVVVVGIVVELETGVTPMTNLIMRIMKISSKTKGPMYMAASFQILRFIVFIV
jgi:hypothetical protein